jgi:hypothetical protein
MKCEKKYQLKKYKKKNLSQPKLIKSAQDLKIRTRFKITPYKL